MFARTAGRIACVASVAICAAAFECATAYEPPTQLIYDNGTTFTDDFRDAPLYRREHGSAITDADDFELSSNYELTGATVYVHDSPNHAWDGKTVRWWVLTDDNGSPGAVYRSGIGTGIMATYGASEASGRPVVIAFAVDRTFVLSGGVRYWLALALSQDGDDAPRSFAMWDTSCYSGWPNQTQCYQPDDTLKGFAPLLGGSVVDGVPDFTGLSCWVGPHNLAFRLWGKPSVPLYPPPEHPRLPPAVARRCAVGSDASSLLPSVAETPSLICSFPWSRTASSTLGGLPLPHGGPAKTTEPGQAMHAAMLRVLTAGGTPEALGEAVQRMATLTEQTPVGQFFDRHAKASLLTILRAAREPRADLARVLVASINAVDLDRAIPPASPVHVKSSGVADLNGVAFVAFHGLRDPGALGLEVRKDTALPRGLEAAFVPWPYCSYHFTFGGRLAEHGFVDVSIDLGRFSFVGRLRDLRVIELDGSAWKDVTVGVDEERRFITARTTKLSSYVVLLPLRAPVTGPVSPRPRNRLAGVESAAH